MFHLFQNKPTVQLTNYHSDTVTNNVNNSHLYSTVMKPHVNLSNQLHKSNTNPNTNYTTLLSTTAPATSITNSPAKVINTSTSHPNISTSGTQPYSSTLTYSTNSRSKDQFVNPYVRTSNSGSNGHPINHYTNVESNDRLLSAGVYNAHRYKTNSLGGGSSSSGVVSTGGSSPGHSPVGSMSGQNGTHV